MFDPTSIPNLAFWFEPSKGGAYQDSAGTATPATSNTDPIGYLPDLSGNGFHATQTTSGSRPTLTTSGINGLAVATFAGSHTLTLGQPAGLESVMNSSTTRFYVFQTTSAPAYNPILTRGGSGGIDARVADIVRGGAFVRYESTYASGLGGGITTGSTYLVCHRFTQLTGGYTYYGTEEVWVNGVRVLFRGANLNSSLTDWVIGGWQGAFFASMKLALVAFYGRALETSELRLFGSYASRYGNPIADVVQPLDPVLNIAMMGNSIWRGAYSGGGGADSATVLGASLKYPARLANFSVDGLTTVDIASSSNLKENVFLTPERPAIVCFFEGTNHIAGNVSGSTALTSALSYIAAQTAAGRRVVACTIPSRGSFLTGGQTIAGFESARQTYNQGLRDNATSYGFKLVDIGYNGNVTINGVTVDCAPLGAPTAYASGTYFADGTHITAAGHAIIGTLLSAAVNEVIPSVVAPVLASVAGYIDTEVAAIKAKTDNLPADPADASDIASALAVISGYIDTEVAAIKAKTDLIPAMPASTGDIPTANQIADAYLDRVDAIETGLTPRGAMRVQTAASAGKVSGAATPMVVIRNVGDTKDRITATTDINGNRTAVTVDPS